MYSCNCIFFVCVCEAPTITAAWFFCAFSLLVCMFMCLSFLLAQVCELVEQCVPRSVLFPTGY